MGEWKISWNMTDDMLWHAHAAADCVQHGLRWSVSRNQPWRTALVHGVAIALALALLGMLGGMWFLEGSILSGIAALLMLTAFIFVAVLLVQDRRASPRIGDGCVIEVGEYWYGPRPAAAKLTVDPDPEVLPGGRHEVVVADGKIVWNWPNGRVWGHAFGWWTRTLVVGDFLMATRKDEEHPEYVSIVVPLSVIGDQSDVERLRELLTNRQASMMAVPQSEQ